MRYGVALTPEAFDGVSIERFMAMVPEAGGVLSWAGEGTQLDANHSTAVRVLDISKRRAWTPVIITGAKTSILENEKSRQALGDKLVDFARREKPPYLGIGNEINFSYRDAQTLDLMVTFFDDVARRVKETSPATRVFPVFQLEWMKGYRGGLLSNTSAMAKSEWELVSRFTRADFIAFTSYPSLVFKHPGDIPDQYYSSIMEHVSKPIAFTEIGWFRQAPNVDGWESTPDEQARYIERIPSLMESLQPVFVIWPFVFDQRIGPPLEYMGFMSPASSTSPGWEAWKEMVKPTLDNL